MVLASMTAAARTAGAWLAAQPPPGDATTWPEFAAAFRAVDGPAGEMLRRDLSALRPDAAWAGELDTDLPDEGEAWVVDAIDGAVQYLQGLPQWCVSVALVRDREPVAAVLHSPHLGETYAAEAGRGVTRNGAPVGPSRKKELAACVVTTAQPPFPEETRQAGASLSAVLPHVAAVRNLGPTSWQIADVAAGRLDAFWQYGADDGNLLGAALLAREAGARVTDLEGRAWTAGAPFFLAAPEALHGPLLELLAAV
ncbi:inositol monophosphatase family protein [Actinomadura macrotermitis]|uniref:Fructose-1, 6-bisphosphatase/inositol-1-monophosphatase n=1 Tax=Actinomadura macrotermitis TaxID=2585200 RepID=A0A7K0C0X4_9ACTN|nr:inositol monophosphatase [Actinomadura macrotermitis]MQY07123.1 Fructose-1,6-bisphosphatase/inositol-1-monophosphatase [Actinomadura macrotermitis]